MSNNNPCVKEGFYVGFNSKHICLALNQESFNAALVDFIKRCGLAEVNICNPPTSFPSLVFFRALTVTNPGEKVPVVCESLTNAELTSAVFVRDQFINSSSEKE